MQPRLRLALEATRSGPDQRVARRCQRAHRSRIAHDLQGELLGGSLVEQGSGRDSEASARGGAALSDVDREPATQVRDRAAQRDLRSARLFGDRHGCDVPTDHRGSSTKLLANSEDLFDHVNRSVSAKLADANGKQPCREAAHPRRTHRDRKRHTRDVRCGADVLYGCRVQAKCHQGTRSHSRFPVAG
jgi:hypothetical protein